MQFAANLSLLFPAVTPWPERFERAAKQGFSGVELLFPYDHPPQFYRALLDAHQMRAVLINTPHEAGSMGCAALPGKRDEFRRSFDQAFAVASELQADAIHIMAGQHLPHATDDWQSHLHENLDYALAQIDGHPVTLQLEALNSQDVPDYAYADPLVLLPFLDQLNHPQVKLQFDFYHTLMQGLDLMATLKLVRPYLGHVQIANPHGRHEPDFNRTPALLEGLKYLRTTRYADWVGLEYRPAADFEQSLSFLRQFEQGAND